MASETPSRPGLAAELRRLMLLISGIWKNGRIGGEARQSSLVRMLMRIVPYSLLRHYVYPTIAGRRCAPYDARRFFDSYYETGPSGVDDRLTVSRDWDTLTTRYHYNSTENAILEYFLDHGVSEPGNVLDVGSGSGHWVDFYLELFQTTRVTALDLSAVSVAALGKRYAGETRVRVVEADIAAENFHFEGTYNIINAVGVMFHIVEDKPWEKAIRNLAELLEPGGRLIVGGQFGWITRNVQFHTTDSFSSWEELNAGSSRVALVNKRIRSLRRWKHAARQAGLNVEAMVRNRKARHIATPENNILVLRKPDPPAK